ncbi:MAG: hypothetical protein E5W83_01760 [Mesorhizobium sp.]|nr:MAG: hypothetical protein E5W89_02620 [Mesorhizobium sp.]TJW48870.1 MAG: hypothetical protein E5W83_01760 [Mesorhizobium sp.]
MFDGGRSVMVLRRHSGKLGSDTCHAPWSVRNGPTHHSAAVSDVRRVTACQPCSFHAGVSLRSSKQVLPVGSIARRRRVIFFGIATPVEAAGIGTFGAFGEIAASHLRKLLGDRIELFFWSAEQFA